MSDALVLAYHAVSRGWDWHFAVRPEQLERHVAALLERGYEPVLFRDLAAATGKRLAVTFDDGFRSVVEHGAPVLERLGVPATMFVVTDFVERGGLLDFEPMDRFRGTPDERELEGITWDDARALAAAGWEIGSHTRTHPALTSVDDARLEDELVTSRAVCEERLGTPCATLAYPFGDHDPRVVAAVRRAGYRLAAAFPPHFVRGDPLRVPRIGLELADEGLRFRLQAARGVRVLRGSPAWRVVRAARSLL